MTELVGRARRYATEAHARINHLRKYTAQPYEVHLKAVADRVATVTKDEEVIAAAWLHDAVEDTPATHQDIEREFGARVAALVSQLTDVSRPSDGNRRRRKEIDREHLGMASDEAKTIKLADLIDNCQDICRNDERFGRVFIAEMAELLPLLRNGNAKLYEKAWALKDKWFKHWGLSPTSTIEYEQSESSAATSDMLSNEGVRRMFAEIFSAKDIAEPLLSFDAGMPEGALADAAWRLNAEVVGLREAGAVRRYANRERAESGAGKAVIRPFGKDQVLSGDAMLSDVIEVLTRHEYCFVRSMGQIAGVITKGDMQKPIARMWLFGMVTLIEMELVGRIKRLWPDEGWKRFVGEARLEKARVLQQERVRRGRQCDLLDCLQLSDKAQILQEDAQQMEEFGFASKRAAKSAAKELESLRNNLAHAQDIVTHDWPQIARMTRHLLIALRDPRLAGAGARAAAPAAPAGASSRSRPEGS